jgi:methyl-accepting chemotaxis protein
LRKTLKGSNLFLPRPGVAIRRDGAFFVAPKAFWGILKNTSKAVLTFQSLHSPYWYRQSRESIPQTFPLQNTEVQHNMKNLRISSKLIVTFLFIAALAILVTGVGVVQRVMMTNETVLVQTHITQPLDYLVKFAVPYGQVRSSTRDIGRSTTAEENQKNKEALETNLALVNRYINAYYDAIQSSPIATAEERDAIQTIRDTLADYTDICLNRLIPAGMTNDFTSVYEIISKDLGPSDAIIRKNADFLSTFSAEQAALALERTTGTLQTSIVVNGLLMVVIVLFLLAMAFYLTGLISKPLRPLTAYMKRAGNEGDLTVTADDREIIGAHAQRKDELGQLIASAAAFNQRVVDVSQTLERIAEGDLTAELPLLSDRDTMGLALRHMTDNLNTMFGEIHASTAQVSTGSKQIADGAQALAQGSTEQAAAVEQLSASISEIADKTQQNAAMAGRAATLSESIRQNAEKGSAQMGQMTQAVKEINDASQAISKVIKTIDDIAFQTNILALNAAVEAARAGQHGKGFAVVAEEVRSLASKSAAAAKDTGALIQNSMEKAGLGAKIADETAESLKEIVSGIHESSALVDDIAKSSEEQRLGIAQSNRGIDQVAQVVQQNSATAEQSAAASEEMSGQSAMLEELIGQFTVRNLALGEARQGAVTALPAHRRLR